MFTGLITHIGSLKAINRQAEGASLIIGCPDDFLSDVSIGDSIATSGSCLTVTAMTKTSFTVDASSETLNRTTILKWQEGRQLNLEKSMTPSGRFGGHFVMGHVDGTARLKEIRQSGQSRLLAFESTPDIVKMIVPKGSVSIDGVSLTPSDRSGVTFKIAVIPHTLEKTTLEKLAVGIEVNVEVDIFARYMFDFISNAKDSGLTIEKLRSEGY